VDFVDNYDGSTQEPRLLPARLPVMLLNGASGIAVGMATEIPPHNLKEVAEACAQTLENDADAKPVTRGIKGPDFPGGGQIISSRDEIKRAYETGRGSVRVRARWNVEKLARGQYRVAVHELPPNTSAAKVLGEIEELTNPKAKAGKKSLTPDQQSLKSAALALLETARDDSDGDHPVRLVFEPRTGKVESQELMDFLLAAHVDGSERGDEPRRHRPRRAPAPDGPRRGHRGVDRLPPRRARAAPQASRRRGRRPHPHPRRPDDRLPQHRQGDQGHPQFRRAQARPHQGIPAFRAPGRGHPRDPAAAARAAGGHQDREGAGRAAQGGPRR
jgi:hypothetical protein